ncbi:MAG: type VI secretion system tip protein VgrG [Myxococcales bacterium]|nr:type VI secretion system tip protein VgrG [Myxococcales bacterium]
MAQDLVTIESDALPIGTHVVSVKGKEGLSEVYRFEVGLMIPDPTFEIDTAIRARAQISFDTGGTPYQFHGIFAAMELVHAWGGMNLYRAVLVPQLWQLRLTRHSRVFIEETIVDIIKMVLESSGLSGSDYAFRLEGSYPIIDFVAQYKESNFAFISRWMEREGMYYYFEQGTDREKLIITDAKGFHELQPGDPLRYVPASSESDMMGDAFSWFTCKSRALPANVELLDYDYVNPALEVKGLATVSTNGVGEISSFGDNFLTSAEGNRLAKIRAEELLARQRVYKGRGRFFHVRPGYTFALEEHPHDALNASYLTTELEHYVNQSANDAFLRHLLGIEYDDLYRLVVTSIPATVQYRSPDRFPWPRVDGYEGAVVCGEQNSDYAQIDEHGRYHVRIKFDESDLDDGKASTWVRMQQPHGGTNEGFHFPLRKGTEVLLFFQGGDPDRPVIAGVVPNTHTPSPVINNNHTLNIIQTGGMNLIQIEDNAGSQYVYVYSPTMNSYLSLGAYYQDSYNLILNTEGHAHFHIGGDQVIDVDVTLVETVQADVTFNYNANWLVNVVADNTIEISGNLNLHVVGEVHYNFDAIWNVCVLDNTNIDIQGNLDIHVVGPTTEIYDADVNISVDGDYIVNVTGNTNHTIENNYDLTVNQSLTQNITQNLTQNITQNLTQNITANYTNVTNATYNITVGGATNESFWDFHAKINGGMTSDTFIGIKNENLIGGKIELALALKLEAHVGVKIETKAAPCIRLETAAIDNTNAWIKSKLAQVSNHATKLDALGIYLVF